MNTETINQIKDLLAPIAEKIGQGASYAWEIVVRQQITEGIACLIGAGIALILVIVGIILSVKSVKGNWGDCGLAGGMMVVFGFVPFIFTLVLGIMNLLNPEYYAIEFFMNLVK